MATQYFDDDENMADLVSAMPEKEQQIYLNYGHRRIEAVFVNRVFIVYQPTGLNAAKRHREPNVLTTILVKDFMVDSAAGPTVRLVDQTKDREMIVGAVPKKIFEYPIYMSVPTRLMLKWDARRVGERVLRSLSFALLIKTKNKADFFSQGNTYCETPGAFSKLYPEVKGEWTF